MDNGKEINASVNNEKQILVEVKWLKKLSAILLVAVILQTALIILNLFT
ncbi:MAG: hypothetical protein UV01_C0018G0015 [Parcubacteria group bacterium GW2011_GWA2_42_14]|nr:MAG: hypothetical protein UV01_C0018G0015 [Parcubacteria group bacterium GW2011_GWA2_42_14]